MCVNPILDKDKPDLGVFQNHNSRQGGQQKIILNKANKVVSEISKVIQESLEKLQNKQRPQFQRSRESEQEKIPLKKINKMACKVNIFLDKVLTNLLYQFKIPIMSIESHTCMLLEVYHDQLTKTRKKISKTNEVATTKLGNAIVDVKVGDVIEDDVINFAQIKYLSRQKALLVLRGTKSNYIMQEIREDHIIVDIKTGNTLNTEFPNYAMKMTNMAIQ